MSRKIISENYLLKRNELNDPDVYYNLCTYFLCFN
jgi:hypothetical protein